MSELKFERRNQPGWPTNPKQWAWCVDYVETGNAYRSALNVDYAEQTAGRNAYKWPEKFGPCLEYILAERKKLTERSFRIDIQRTLNEYAAIGYAVISDYVAVERNEQGEVTDLRWKLPDELTEDQAKAVAKINFSPDHLAVESYELHNKLPALEKIGKKLGLFSERLLIQSQTTVEVKHDLTGLPTDLLESVEMLMTGGGRIADQDTLRKATQMLSKALPDPRVVATQ